MVMQQRRRPGTLRLAAAHAAWKSRPLGAPAGALRSHPANFSPNIRLQKAYRPSHFSRARPTPPGPLRRFETASTAATELRCERRPFEAGF